MSVEAGVSSRLAELRDRVEKDPKSRLFVQLADEYRRAGQAGEAIAVLRRGLEHHSTYVSAWNALGKLYVESGRDHDAIPVFERVLGFDPQNVVAARLLGDAQYRRGNFVEAIKRYKLVRAIAPGDDELEGLIQGLEERLGAQLAPALPPPPPPEEAAASPEEVLPAAAAAPDLPLVALVTAEEEPPLLATESEEAPGSPEPTDESSPFDDSAGRTVDEPADSKPQADLEASDLWRDSPASEGGESFPAPDASYRTTQIPAAAELAEMGRRQLEAEAAVVAPPVAEGREAASVGFAPLIPTDVRDLVEPPPAAPLETIPEPSPSAGSDLGPAEPTPPELPASAEATFEESCPEPSVDEDSGLDRPTRTIKRLRKWLAAMKAA
jgi:Tfp pilus assembly protein PilF